MCFRAIVVSSCWLGLCLVTAHGVDIVIDDFETGEGHFNLAPSFSGTTQGETEVAGVGPSTADQDITVSISGVASQRIFLDDDPAVDVANTSPVQAWRLRHLSGGGTPGNNTSLATVPNGHVGFYLMTTTPNLQASIFIDDGTALERAAYVPIIADGSWNLYQWSFADADQWEAFAGTGPNGIIDAASVTIDGIFISAIKDAGIPDQNATFNIDYVVTNPEGLITGIPEPSAALLLGICGVLGLSHRNRH